MIHWSGQILQRFNGHTHVSYQLDQPGDSFYFEHNRHFNSNSEVDGGSAHFAIFAPGGAFAGFYNTCALNSSVASVSNLNRGQPVSSLPFVGGGPGIIATAGSYGCGGGWRGQFLDGGIGFIGFKFNNGSGDQYGWARIKMKTADSSHLFQLVDYAYGDVGDRIRVGQKSGGHSTELESLGGLALGAAGLLAWRRRCSLLPRT